MANSILADIEPCELWHTDGSSNTSQWFGDGHSLELASPPPELKLHVGLFNKDYSGLAAGRVNLMNAGFGSNARVSRGGVHDSELTKVAMCLAHETQSAYSGARVDVPEPHLIVGAPEELAPVDLPMDSDTPTRMVRQQHRPRGVRMGQGEP